MGNSFTNNIDGVLISDSTLLQLASLDTDQDWVRFHFGEPDEVRTVDGQEQWVYKHRQTQRKNNPGATTDWYERVQRISFTPNGAIAGTISEETQSAGWATRHWRG